MWQLYQFPLCPFSRKVRLLLGEKGIGYDLVRESPWLQRDEFLDMNPAGSTPVMTDTERNITLIDSKAIREYFEETIEKFPLISGGASGRAGIRRPVAWFDENFYGDVRSEENTSELKSLMRISYAVFCLKKKTKCIRRYKSHHDTTQTQNHNTYN